MGVLRRLRQPRALALLALVSLCLLWIIVPSGAIVRLTGSGLGCPDWPLCDGSVTPASDAHAVIEYVNRLLSGVVVGGAILTWLAAWWAPGASRPLRNWSLATAGATAAQAPLGAVTVLSGLHPLAVGSHFLLSMVALAAGALTWLHARDRRDGRERSLDLRRGPMALIVLAAGAVVLVTGVLVTAAGPHPGDPDVVRTWGNLAQLASVHVRAAFIFTALVLVMVAWLWREGGVDRTTARLAGLAVPLVLLQITVGEYQYRTGLPWQVVIVHVSIAGLLWAVMVGATWGVLRPAALPAPGPRSGGAAAAVASASRA